MKPTYPTLRILPALLAILLLLLTLACTRRPLHQPTYDRVSRIIDSLPDQALAILDSIRPSELQPGLDSARYILLHAIAEDKTYQLRTDTSSLLRASRIFEQYRQRDELRYCLYMLGRVNYDNEDYTATLEPLLHAEQLIDDDTPLMQKALIYHSLADYCNTTMNGLDALLYIQKALECYTHASKPLHVAYAKGDKAIYLLNSTKFQEAKELFLDVKRFATEVKDTILLAACYDGLARSYTGLKEYEKALGYVHQLDNVSDTLDSQTIGLLSYLEKLAGDKEKADSISTMLLAKGESWGTYGLVTDPDDPNQVLNAYIQRDDETSRTLIDVYQNEYASAMRNNLELQQQLLKYKIKNRRIINCCLGILAIFLFLAIILIINYFRKRTKRQNEYNSHLYEDLIYFTRFHEEELSKLNSDKQKASSILLSVLQKYIGSFNLMAQSYNERRILKKDQDKLTVLIGESIEELRNNREIAEEIENLINLKHDNLLLRLKQVVPSLKDRDIQLFTLQAIGFSSLTISEIMKVDSLDYLRVLKFRLRGKLTKQNPPSLQDFINVL